jgi:excisionase family DNA binding protein
MPAASRPRAAACFPEVLDVHLTAHFLTVSADTVYDLFQRGDLPGWKVGRTWLITKAAVLRWLEASTTQSTAAAQDAALAHAIANGDQNALLAAVHTGTARIRRPRQPADGLCRPPAPLPAQRVVGWGKGHGHCLPMMFRVAPCAKMAPQWVSRVSPGLQA